MHRDPPKDGNVGNQFKVSLPQAVQPFSISWKGGSLTSEFPRPLSRPGVPALHGWVHHERTEQGRTLGGRKGRVISDLFSAGGMSVTREVWVEENRDSVAVRVKLLNGTATPRRLDALLPIQCRGNESLLLNEAGVCQWDVLRQARMKNGVPTSVRPGCFDADYAQAASEMGELGDQNPGRDENPISFEADSFFVARPQGDEGARHFLMGFLSQLANLAHFILRTDVERRNLESLAAECEFDGCVVSSGDERASQWVLLMSSDDPNDVVAEFADRVGRHHQIKPPRQQPPSVCCSWQYYGPHFKESDFAEDMAYFEEDRVPFDVFLIDDCWNECWGDWRPRSEWPSGMKAAAERIKALGYRAGLWTCPFLARPHSRLAAEHNEWLLRLDDGALHTFKMDGLSYVLDPTCPGVSDWLEELYRRLTHDWGFTHHKLDFMRAVFMNQRASFYNASCTRLEAYRTGLAAIRRGMGPDAYLSVCGGHYGGSVGLADSQRSGSDVASSWHERPALPKIKQNLLRTWMNRLWHVDPDAMMIRRRDRPINDTRHGFLSLGKFTDEEAKTITVNQYLGGGLVCLCEKFSELDADRRALYRHVIPTIQAPSKPIDFYAPTCPSLLLTCVNPVCDSLGPWLTLTVANWDDTPTTRAIDLDEKITKHLPAQKYLLNEFFEQRALGIFTPGSRVDLGAFQSHSVKVVKIIPWDGHGPVLVSTDLHLSGGGIEIVAWQVGADHVRGKLTTPWKCGATVTAAFPSPDGFQIASATLAPGEEDFVIRRHSHG